MTDTVAVIAVVVLFYPLMSVFEWLVHRQLMHRRSLPAWAYRAVPALKQTLDAHNKFHHGECFRDRFDHDRKLPCNLFNLTLDVPVVPLIGACAAVALLSLWAAGVLAVLVVAHHWLWGQIHREMHIPGSARWVRWLPCWRAWHRNHELHHEQPGRNFCIVCLGADRWFGTTAATKILGKYAANVMQPNERRR